MATKKVMEISGRRKYAVRFKDGVDRKPMAIIGIKDEVVGTAGLLVVMTYGEPLDFELESIPFSAAAAKNC